jgi:hypothetical protein
VRPACAFAQGASFDALVKRNHIQTARKMAEGQAQLELFAPVRKKLKLAKLHQTPLRLF